MRDKDKDKVNGKDKCHIIILTTRKTRQNFKTYCHEQGVSVILGMNTLMRTASRKNFPIRTKMRME